MTNPQPPSPHDDRLSAIEARLRRIEERLGKVVSPSSPESPASTPAQGVTALAVAPTPTPTPPGFATPALASLSAAPPAQRSPAIPPRVGGLADSGPAWDVARAGVVGGAAGASVAPRAGGNAGADADATGQGQGVVAGMAPDRREAARRWLEGQRAVAAPVKTDWVSFEQIVGQRWTSIVGALVFVIGMGLLLLVAWRNGWFQSVPPGVKCGMGALVGFAMLGAAEVVRKRMTALAAI
ncbi:MAG: DUF2339 domain-containing protein, partial [Phycisphaerales bacterium]|nr:DUF2339 domain-containing protein [Phycisphaerales bacterium]